MEDASFPVGAACRIDARSPWRHVGEIPVGLDPEGIAIDSARRRAFVACSRSDFVSVIDLDTHEVVREIATGAEPIDIGFDETTSRVFSADAHADQITIIDAETLEIETAVPVGGYPSGLTHVPETRRLYVGKPRGIDRQRHDVALVHPRLQGLARIEVLPRGYEDAVGTLQQRALEDPVVGIEQAQ